MNNEEIIKTLSGDNKIKEITLKRMLKNNTDKFYKYCMNSEGLSFETKKIILKKLFNNNKNKYQNAKDFFKKHNIKFREETYDENDEDHYEKEFIIQKLKINYEQTYWDFDNQKTLTIKETFYLLSNENEIYQIETSMYELLCKYFDEYEPQDSYLEVYNEKNELIENSHSC